MGWDLADRRTAVCAKTLIQEKEWKVGGASTLRHKERGTRKAQKKGNYLPGQPHRAKCNGVEE